jgi:hypothetical protein
LHDGRGADALAEIGSPIEQGAASAKVRSHARSLIDLDDEGRGCEAGRAPHSTAGALEFILDKNITQARSCCPRAVERFRQGILFVGAAICSRIHHERISGIRNEGHKLYY